MSELVGLERRGAVALLTLDNPPVNAVGAALRTRLGERIAEIAGDPAVEAAVLTGAGRAFIAGADIREFNVTPPPGTPTLRELIVALERCPKPLVAAINGACAGGGLEIALGCHVRIAAPAARIGLPEVKLGLLPGAGGTQRLTRLIGPEAALAVIVEGELLPAADARRLGLVDAVEAEDLIAAAVTAAERLAETGTLPTLPFARDDRIAPARGDTELFAAYRTRLATRARGFVAPFHCVDCIEAAVNLPFEEGMRFERASFEKCLASSQSRALRYLFFAEREAAKIDGLPPGTAPGAPDAVRLIGPEAARAEFAERLAKAGVAVADDAGLAVAVGAAAPDGGIGAVVTRHRGAPGVLEILAPRDAAPETLATAMRLGRALRLPAVLVRGDAAIGEALRDAWRAAAEELAATGVAPARIEAALYAFGFAAEPGAADAPSAPDDGEIALRIVLAMADRGARMLEAGVAQRASDIDIVAALGLGFPRYRGGPMLHADTIGLAACVEGLRRAGRTPAPLIERLAAGGGTLTGW